MLNRVSRVSTIAVVGIGIAACSSSNPPEPSAVDSGQVSRDTGTSKDTGGTPPKADSAVSKDTGVDAPPAASVTLTVMNFLDWCSVSINGGAASANATVSATVTGGSVATIVATPASGAFQIGPDPWFGVDQNNGSAAPGTDVGSGTTETSTAKVTISGSGTQCVSVCCQEPNNSPTPCPTTNPCP